MFKKRFVILCLSVFLSVSCGATVLAGDNADMKADVLKGLGILTETRVNRGIFVESLGRFLYDEDMFTAEEIARQTGMVSANEEFDSKGSITVGEAVKYSVITLGYKTMAEIDGDYMKTAAQLGITDGINGSVEGRLKYETAAGILYNMLDIEPMLRVFGTDEDYRVEEDSTLLELNRDIYEIEGVVTADAFTELYKEGGTGDSLYVSIDKEYYLVGNTNAEEFLGQYVTAYVKDLKDDYEIVYIGAKTGKNNILEIQSENIEFVSEDYSEIEYWENEKIKKVKLSDTPGVIYNGVSYAGYTEEDLMPDVGNIRLVDNDGDNKYDIVFVTSYETMVVESVDVNDKIVTNRYRFDGCIDILTLEGTSNDIYYEIYDSDGAETSFNSIKINNVLSVAKSKNSDDSVVKIYISGSAGENGTVTSVNAEDGEIGIDGKIFGKSEAFEKYLSNTLKQIKVGGEYIFFTDYFGNVAYVKSVQNSAYKLLYKVYADDDETSYAVFMDTDNEWYTLPLKKKIKYDGETVDSTVVVTMLKNAEPQVVVLKTNLNNEVYFIDTAENYTEYRDGVFSKLPNASYTYRSGPVSFGMKYFIAADTLLFVTPEDKKNKDGYYVRAASGYFSGDTDYTVELYDIDKFNFASVVTITENAETAKKSASGSFVIITSVGEGVLGDDVLPMIKTKAGKFKNFDFFGSKSGIFEGLKKGDVINIGTDYSGKVIYVEKIFSMTDFIKKDAQNYYVPKCFVSGIVEDISLERGAVIIDCGKTSTFKIANPAVVQKYNSARNFSEDSTVGALKVGDKILCRLSYGQINEIVCLDE